MTIDEIDCVCFVGAGTMGCFNALLAATSGYQAVLYDISEDALNQVQAKQAEMSSMLMEAKFFNADAIPEALTRITLSSDLRAATANAQLVSESVAERRDLKREVHKQLDLLCPAATILTTNTSSLLVSNIEDAVTRGELFAALHSHLGSPLIDIVGGPRTAPATIDILKRYVTSINGIPLVLKKENPGYVLNAMLGALLTMAKMLVIEGVASSEDIDRAWMLHSNAPMGPFGLMDMFGIDVIFDSWREPKPDPNAEKLKPKIIPFLSAYIDKGELGMKTGKGFYTYPDPAYKQAGFLTSNKDLSIPYQTLVSTLILNAVSIAQKGVASPKDVDRAWMAAMGLDVGPFGILEAMRSDEFHKMLTAQVTAGMFAAENAALVESWLRSQDGCG